MLQGKEKEGKITRQWNIGHSDLQKIYVHLQCYTEQVPKYDAYLLDRARDIKQNHWTM